MVTPSTELALVGIPAAELMGERMWLPHGESGESNGSQAPRTEWLDFTYLNSSPVCAS